jgi:RNA polymerase sigma-70 factor (ECF subfamily)
MSYEEAASALDCPVGTVRSRLHRARALLLEKLREPELVRGSAEGD